MCSESHQEICHPKPAAWEWRRTGGNWDSLGPSDPERVEFNACQCEEKDGHQSCSPRLGKRKCSAQQSSLGSFKGILCDPSGQVIPGAGAPLPFPLEGKTTPSLLPHHCRCWWFSTKISFLLASPSVLQTHPSGSAAGWELRGLGAPTGLGLLPLPESSHQSPSRDGDVSPSPAVPPEPCPTW